MEHGVRYEVGEISRGQLMCQVRTVDLMLRAEGSQ